MLGIENCLQTDSVVECHRTECPFAKCRDTCQEVLLQSVLAMLREQEPLKPFYSEADDSWICRYCCETVGYGEFNPGGIDPVRNKYCPECGREVKWDD